MEEKPKMVLERNLIKQKLKEYIDESKRNIDSKMEKLTSLIKEIKEENEKVIIKCKLF